MPKRKRLVYANKVIAPLRGLIMDDNKIYR